MVWFTLIIARSAETDEFYAAFNSTVFEVVKHASSVNITVNDNYEIETDFTIGIENNTAVNVTINGVEYPVVDGKVVIDTTALAAGNYTVTATIYESDKYLGNATSKTFTVYCCCSCCEYYCWSECYNYCDYG